MSTINDTPMNPVTPEEVVRQLRALREQIPDFTLQSPDDVRTLVRAAAVNDALVHASIIAIAASPPLQNALGRDAESLRSENELLGRWSEVVDELEAIRLGVIGAIRVRRHRLGGTAFQTMGVSRQLVRYRENANLLPHIDAMKRASKVAKRRAKQPTPVPVPEPVQAPDVKKAQ